MGIWVQHISLAQVLSGDHYDPGGRGAIIRIQDFGSTTFAPTSFKFDIEARYTFDDLLHESYSNIQEWEAKAIAIDLIKCRDERRNLIVSCHAGISRSGAIAQVAEMLGFILVNEYDRNNNPSPNTYVKAAVVKAIEKLNNEGYRNE